MFPVSVPRMFKIARRAPVVELHISKVIEEISAVCNLAEIYHVGRYIPKSKSRNSEKLFYPSCVGLHTTGCNATKNEELYSGVSSMAAFGWMNRKLQRNKYL